MSEYYLQKFFEACGVGDGFTLAITNEGTGKTFQKKVSLPFALIGRNPLADLSLHDQRVSLKHAYLQMMAGRLLCVDLQSRTGIHWESGSEKSGWLDKNQSIRIGPFRIELADNPSAGAGNSGPDSKRLLTRNEEEDGLPQVTLEFRKADHPGKRSPQTWKLDRVLTFVGQSSECKIRLTDPSVSAFHCSLLRTRQGVWVVDLLSRNGIKLNGQSLRWAALQHRDELQVGAFLIRFHYDSSPLALPVPTKKALSKNTDSDSPKDAEPEIPLDTAQAAGEYLQSLSSTPFPTHTDFWKSIISPLFGQFSLMQQHMFDQFQKSLVMVVQMLNSQHQSQFELVREELDSLRKLNVELAVLQAEMVKHQVPPRRGPRPATAEGGQAGPAPASEDQAPASLGGKKVWLPDFPFAEADVPPAAEAQEAAFPDAAMDTEKLAEFLAQATEPLLAELPAAEEESSSPPPEKEQQKPSIAAPTGEAGREPEVPDVHRLIAERLKALQKERQSLWQRILQKISG